MIISDAGESEILALKVPDTNGVYMVPAFTGLGAPYWDSQARGAIIGITRGTKREHIVRSALESIAYQTADVMSAMHSDSNVDIRQLKVDGGATANNFLMQFQSDILGIEVDRPQINETTALGAAFLAGLRVGFWEDKSQLEKCRKTSAVFEPSMDENQRRRLLDGWHLAVKRVLYRS